MKLELKHLAGYLPYGLKIVDIWEEMDVNIKEMTGLYSFGDIYTNDGEIDFELIKPILHPLSDLTQEYIKNDIVLSDFAPQFILSNRYEWSFGFIERLLELHFDIHGLIAEGLAIDINTLNK